MAKVFLTGVNKGLGYNPNLLINPDFEINQRGEASYTLGAATAYTYDRWKLFYNAAFSNCTVQKTSAGLSFTCDIGTGGNYNIFGQDIEDVNGVKGKIVTFTAKISSVSGNFFIGMYDGVNQLRSGAITADGVVRLTARLDASATRFLAYLGASGVQTHSCVIEWVKIEIGAIATPFCPPDPAEELQKCQRYYFAISSGDNFTEYCFGNTTSASGFLLGIDTPVQMRTSPTMTISSPNDFTIRYGSDKDNNYNLMQTRTSTLTLRKYNGTNAILSGTVVGNFGDWFYSPCTLRSYSNTSKIEFDAEIY